MGISWRSREIVRLEHSRAAHEFTTACQRDVAYLTATLPRGGGSQKAVDDRYVECVRQSFAAWRQAYLRAYEQEEVELTVRDIAEICDEMLQATRSLWTSRVELTPRSVGIGFRDSLDQVVREQRVELELAMKRMQRDREFPRRSDVSKNVYNISGPNARVNINSTDSSVNMLNVTTNQLFADLKAAIQREIHSVIKRDELLARVAELESKQGTSAFLLRYQEFIAALADHIGVVQAFLRHSCSSCHRRRMPSQSLGVSKKRSGATTDRKRSHAHAGIRRNRQAGRGAA